MLPIKTLIAVKPWFREQTLAKAETLLAQGADLLLHYRRAAAALFPGLNGYCLINFAKAPQIPQGFRIVQAECSICQHRQRVDDHCLHVAALALSLLIDADGALCPAPLLFPDSVWSRLASFLNDQADAARIDRDNEPGEALTFQAAGFSARITLKRGGRALLPIIFSNWQFPAQADDFPFDHAAGQAARDRLLELCRTETELALNAAGRTSQGQKEAAGLWTQLCHQLFLEQPEPEWQLHRGTDQRFSLCTPPPAATGLWLTPRRDQTVRLLEHTGNLGLIIMAGVARAYSRIGFQEDGSLLIEPWLELADGHKERRSDLAGIIFGPYCAPATNTFLRIQEQEDDFSAPATPAGLPLLAFAKKSSPAESITIPAPEVPAFLATHRRAIFSGGHEVDPALAEFSIRDLPDAIEVRNYHEDGDWCYLDAGYSCGSRRLELRDILAARAKGGQHATGGGRWLRIEDTPLDWLYDLAPERLSAERGSATLRLTRLEMMALTSLVPQLKLPAAKKQRRNIKERLATLKGKELAAADIPPHLRPYQRTGLAWLNHLCANGIGGILADDMGLGKTHQALAQLRIVLRGRSGPALVVCPASVLPHWQDKIDSFYPDLDYTVYYGQQRNLAPVTAGGLLLTTYGILRQDSDLLAQCSFGLIFFDEIQYLKNHRNATSKAAARLDGRIRFGLSGTPIENSLTDLKAIYDLCLPGLLGSHGYFQKTYVAPIEENHDQGRLQTLQRLINPFMLRRHKSAVLTELPAVIEDIRTCYLSADQQTLYQQAIANQGRELLAAVNDPAAPFPHLGFLALIQLLKQICNHPCQLAKNVDYQRYDSGKWQLFKEILRESLAAGLKVVVFSQYTSMLDIIEQYLRDRNVPHTGLRGSTPPEKRRRLLASFNSDPTIRVFCASLLAGGTGIDLTGAQVVIHYDRWWNSAREEQATARVHRFGQQQAVQVFKFITAGTLEEKIHHLIGKKQGLAEDAVLSDDGSILKKLSREEISAILQWTPAV
jgi:superfamily II DNA or RNA helicase